MILEALRVLLFGMLGIFVVMAVIFAVIVLLSRISAWTARHNGEVVIPVDGPGEEAVEYVAETEEYVDDGEYVADGEYVVAGEYVVDDGDVEYVEEGDWELEPVTELETA